VKKQQFKLIAVLSAVILFGTLMSGCGKANSSSSNGKALVKVRLNEVARSVFYAPMYAAINEGYFKDEGIDIDLSTGQGAVI
jgi:NitT/TauT family transport system substrate-binding protein